MIRRPPRSTLFPYTSSSDLLIDALPDEASLGTMLAHELGHVVLGHRMDPSYGFFDNQLVEDRKSTRLNSSHSQISYAVFCLKKKKGHRAPSPTRPRHAPPSR